MRKTKTVKTVLFALGLAVAMLSAGNVSAQEDGSKGLFGRGDSPEEKENIVVREGGLINYYFETEGIDGISNYGIGEEAPMGSGLLILLGASLGYVALKKKED